jgi:hypothetical protein
VKKKEAEVDDNDKNLTRIMEKIVAEPVADGGFTEKAARRLRGRRKHAPFPKRAVGLAALAAGASLAVLLPLWDEVAAFALLLQENAAAPGANDANASGTVLAASLVATVALASVMFFIDRAEASR